MQQNSSQHWLATLEIFLEAIESENLNKLTALTDYVSADVYEFFEKAAKYDAALELLKTPYTRTPNKIFARHHYQPGNNSQTKA